MAKKVTDSKCPHCGSTHGYYYSIRLIEERNGSWGELSDHGGFSIMRRTTPKTAKCIDCDRRVERRSAEGE